MLAHFKRFIAKHFQPETKVLRKINNSILNLSKTTFITRLCLKRKQGSQITLVSVLPSPCNLGLGLIAPKKH